MKISIVGRNGKHPTDDATMVQFTSSFGRAAGWWHGAVPEVGAERFVEFSIEASDVESSIIEPDAGPRIEGLEGGRIRVRGTVTSLEGSVASLAIGDSLLLVDALPTMKDGETITITAREIHLFDEHL
jgi:hypothetical protein